MDWFQRHVNLSSVILCQDVRELRSLYFHIDIIVQLFLRGLVFTQGPIECE